MGFKLKMRRYYIPVLILIPIVFLSWIFHPFRMSVRHQDNLFNYKGWLSGIAADGSGSRLVAYNPNDSEIKTVLNLPNVTPDNFGVISSDGTKAAYTQWNEQQSVRYLVIHSLTDSKQKTYFDDLPPMNEIKTISWFPDNRKLLFVKNDQSNHVYQEISVLDTSSGNVETLVKGGVWQVKGLEEANGQEITKFYMTQGELEKLVKKYGGQPVPLDDAGGYIMVEFTAPVISPDGERIVYSATLNRNYAKGEYVPLWLASSIWVYDLKSGENNMIHSTSDHSAIGKAIWTSDGKHIAFISYTGPNGEHGSVEYIDLASMNVQTLFSPTPEHYNNANLIALDRNEITFISAPQSGTYNDAERWILNPDTGETRLMQVQLKGQNSLLRNYSNVQ